MPIYPTFGASAGMGLNADEIRRLHGAIFELIRQSENVLYAGVGFPTRTVPGTPTLRRMPTGAFSTDAILFGEWRD
jgi:hypothetical protein